jgi:hypothetical protein
MALRKSALSDLLDALRAGGDLDVIREGLALVLQALIDAEAIQHIGARPYERSEQRTAYRNGSRSRLLSTRPAMSSSRSPSCGRARSSRRCWSRAGASTGPCWRWSWRPMCMAPPPARSTTSCERSGWRPGSPSRRCPGSAPSWMARWPPSGPAHWPRCSCRLSSQQQAPVLAMRSAATLARTGRRRGYELARPPSRRTRNRRGGPASPDPGDHRGSLLGRMLWLSWKTLPGS